MAVSVLLYVPNLIGYTRLLLLFTSWTFYYTNPFWSLVTYGISASLDAVDGYAARKLNQCSAFGAWLDVVVDILGRGMIWCRVYHFGYLVAAVEWLTFVCTHTLGSEWKSSFVQTPWWVKSVMAQNFKTPMGIIAITGLQVLPIWLYAHYTGLLSMTFHIPRVLQYLGIGLFAAGRALCLAVELWCIYSHIRYLTSEEANKTSNNSKATSTTSS